MEQVPYTQRMGRGEMISQNTKERIVAALEFLLIHKGPSISMRAIANAAGVNIAAINYYFGSKDQLFEWVFKRRFALLNEVCSKELQKIYDTDVGESLNLPVSRILRTYLGPFFGGSDDMVLIGKAMMTTDRDLQAASADVMKPSREMLLEMLCEVLPDLPEEVLRLRFLLSMGALGYTLVLAAKGGVQLDELQCVTQDCLVDVLVSFLSSAFIGPL